MGYSERVTRWKSITSWEQLEKFLLANPDQFVYRDRTNKERQFWVASRRDEIGLSVDGRSVRVLMLHLKRENRDGGKSLPLASTEGAAQREK